MQYVSLIIGSIGLLVSLASLFWSWWLNQTSIIAKFKWTKSENDDSWHLRISLSNVASRTATITSLILKSGDEIVEDNGYDYDQVEQKNKDAAHQRSLDKHQEKLRQIENMPHEDNESSYSAIFGNTIDALKRDENFRYQQEQMHGMNQSLLHSNKHLTVVDQIGNFTDFEPIFGNHTNRYAYWISPDKIPNQLTITSSSFINRLSKSKSFDIPAIPNKVDQSNDVKN